MPLKLSTTEPVEVTNWLVQPLSPRFIRRYPKPLRLYSGCGLAVVLKLCSDSPPVPATYSVMPRGRVRCTARVEGAESQVVVPVTVEDDVRTGGVEGVPPRLVGRCLSGATAGEERLVPEGEGAGLRGCGEVGREPLRLRRGRAASADVLSTALGVEADQVPVAEVEREVSDGLWVRRCTEVVEVGLGGGVARRALPAIGVVSTHVLVVTGDGCHEVVYPTP